MDQSGQSLVLNNIEMSKRDFQNKRKKTLNI